MAFSKSPRTGFLGYNRSHKVEVGILGMQYVLGIESSCDETGMAIYGGEPASLLADVLHSQIALHQQYGGVVPELASRDHVKRLVPLLQQVLGQANVSLNDITAIAYTKGPGLVGALLTGACFAKSLAFSLGIPAFGVHHLEAHILAAQLGVLEPIDPSYLALLVSGGHSQWILVEGLGQYRVLGDTLDDAVGEAFDKTAKMMGIAYPGGAKLALLADTCPAHLRGRFGRFPRPMLDRPNCDMSFSGLKTHALQCFLKSEQTEEDKQAIAYAFQEAVVDTLLAKAQRALDETGCRHLVIAGGVGANQHLRAQFTAFMQARGGAVFFPEQRFCTDNGAMIAFAGYQHIQAGRFDDGLEVEVKARWPL